MEFLLELYREFSVIFVVLGFILIMTTISHFRDKNKIDEQNGNIESFKETFPFEHFIVKFNYLLNVLLFIPSILMVMSLNYLLRISDKSNEAMLFWVSAGILLMYLIITMFFSNIKEQYMESLKANDNVESNKEAEKESYSFKSFFIKFNLFLDILLLIPSLLMVLSLQTLAISDKSHEAILFLVSAGILLMYSIITMFLGYIKRKK